MIMSQYLLVPTLVFFCLVYITTFATSDELRVFDNIAISCGSSGNSTAPDGRVWVGDIGRKPSMLLQVGGKSTKSRPTHSSMDDDAVPYKNARISTHDFSYTFPVNPGQKFIRLHFNPAPYKGFKNSKPFFSVRAGPYTLLGNFTPGAASHFSKEFCVNTEENQASLTVTFSPIHGPFDSYAFVNGIEVVCIPTGLYFTPDDDRGPLVVGQKYRFYIDNSTALEMVRRINIGGNSIPSVEDGIMFREWTEDLKPTLETGNFLIKRTIPISYTSTPSHVAPKKVYQSARSVIPGKRNNLTWKIPLDLGFRYLVRFHFCELDLRITTLGEREFSIIINNQVAEKNVDLIRLGGKHGIALYRDYVVLMEGERTEGKRCLNVTFQPNLHLSSKETYGILNGLEIFKLSNPDNNLASLSSSEAAYSTTSWTREHKKMQFFLESKNAVATMLTIIITLLNIIVYHIRRLSETNYQWRYSTSSSSENHCRQFSIDEIRSTTNNFSSEHLIGSGGYGRVYKGSIDRGATIVAIKRLKQESRQGDREFWTEIKMLSKLRHDHLVRLIGYCNDGQERVLVYDYMTRGTLADHLYKAGRHGVQNPSLSWEERLKISIGAARGLYFLHTSGQRVIHRDVKSSNILLDENWVAKISDFGLSKMGPPNESFSHISTNVKGTFGYLDPEYFLTRKLTRKSDVYAFGVVLFEVLSGRPSVDIRLEEEQHSLAAWARYCLRKGKSDKLIDSNLIEQISPSCLKVFMGIAGRCVDTHPHERPAMADVVVSLELALVLQQDPSSSEQVDEEENMNVGSYSDQSDGAFSLDDLSGNPTNGGTEQTATKEVPGTAPRPKELEVPRNSRKDNNSASSRWWWDAFRLLPRSPSKTKASSPLPQEGLCSFSMQELRKATNNFHNSFIIGFGDSDSIYKCHIDGIKQMVAVRRSSTRESRSWMAHELQSKMEVGLSAKHVHVLTLVGYCKDEPEMILIYDYMAYGSLHDHLCDPTKDPLPWNRRLRICIDVARGLSYLQSTFKQTNLHRTLKSTNIVLDENWVAKVSSFGLSKRRVNNAPAVVRGNWGFLDSDYIRDDQLTEKSYIFSFGLLLFEVLCAMKDSTRWLDEDQVSLALWVKSGLRNNLSGCIDPFLAGKISPECFGMFVETASKCLHDKGFERPSFDDIIANLEAALHLQAAFSFSASSLD